MPLSRAEYLDAWKSGYDFRVREEEAKKVDLPANVTDLTERIAARALRRPRPTTRTGQ